MKLRLLVAVPLAVVGWMLVQPSHAEPAKKPAGASNARKVARVKQSPCWDKLGLTEKQKASLQDIRENSRLKVRAIKESNKSDDQKKAEIKKLAQAQQEQIAKVLTKAQAEQLRECLKTERQKQGKTRAAGAKKARKPAAKQ